MRTLWLAGVVTFLLAGAAGADVWDVGLDTDNNNGTDNELAHGTAQVHDLGALAGPVADQDWYRFYLPQYTSWEVLVDGTTGDVCAGFGAGIALELFEADGVTPSPIASYGLSPFQCSRSINLRNSDLGTDQFVRVMGVDCTTDCDANDQYTIHARETTLYVPRFNNSATQVTLCIVQHADDTFAVANLWFFDGAGALLGTTSAPLNAHGAMVINTAGVAGVAGKSGSIMIENTARYGRMQAKCVALEPATGFTFDTPAVTRPD